MFEREKLPTDMDDMAPGLELSAVLGSVDWARLNGHDVVRLLRAQARQIAHLQAQQLAAMVEVAYCPPGDAESPPERCEDPEEFASDEIRAALTLTRRAAGSDLELACSVWERLPQVGQALEAGLIDLRRARTIVCGVGHLTTVLARQVVDEVMNRAAFLTTGQLSARIRRLCIAVDPDDAKERYEEGVGERRVVVDANPEGTANLYGIGLPPDRVSAIRRKINQLAKTLKRADDPRTIDQIRADIFLDLLEGNQPAKKGPRGTVDIRVDLKTLMGLSDNPGEIPGWGPLIADLTRQVANQGRWRVTVTDRGDPVWTGLTRRRATAQQKHQIQAALPTCVFPGCRMPSAECDLDHTQAYSEGGPTTVANQEPLCRHEHQLKTVGGWKLHKTGPGQYKWTSPFGHSYTTNHSHHPP